MAPDKNVLIVDDEPWLCKALAALFVQKGFRVTTASTAREALEYAQRAHADIALLDINLPDASGLDVLSALRQRFPRLRIIVISGVDDEAIVQQAIERGASTYLAKPFEFEHCYHVAMGLGTVDLTAVAPDPGALSRLPADIAQRCQALPMRWDGETLHVAMADPTDDACLSQLRERLQCAVVPLGVASGDLHLALRRYYEVEPSHRASPAPSQVSATGARPPAAAVAVQDHAATDRLIEDLIRHAHLQRATDLHLGYGPTGAWVRERIDGQMTEAPAPAGLDTQYERLIERLKGLAGLDTIQRRLPQQGRIMLDIGTSTLDLRLSVLPTAHTEHATIRLLETSQIIPFDALGLAEDQRLNLASLLAKSTGLVLVTGPAGSGKSSTLYACLTKLNTGRLHLVTVEDPVDHELPGITQMPVQGEAGLTFVEGLRAALQHDPNVIMISELRDAETTKLAVRAALTGHLVLASLHTTDAASGIARLLDFGVEPFFLCSTLSAVLSQRLVRTVCSDCREVYEIEAASATHLGVSLPKPTGAVSVWRGKGCAQCRQTGYRGRTGAFELLVVDHHIRSLIMKRASGTQIRQSALSRGMTGLPQALWQKVESGTTSLQELIHILAPHQQ